jgi:hypothetical protein
VSLVQVRVVVANLMRLLCDAMGSSALSSQPLVRARIYEWVRETYIFLRQISPFRDGFWEVSQVGGEGAGVDRGNGF